MTTAAPPSFTDVLAARRRIAPYLRPTPLFRYAGLDRLVGTTVWVKHENHQPVGAFKVRGGINFVSQMDADERRRGIVTASTGNHGQSIAYGARLFDVKSIVCAPEQANPLKIQAIRDLGAEVVLRGRNFDEAKAHAEELAGAHGYRYVHSGDEPHLISGVATYALEIFEEQPGVDTLIVPIGGGSGAAGASLVQHVVKPGGRVIGVQSERAPSAFRSWQQRAPVTAANETLAEGLSTGQPFELPQRMLRDLLADFVLVSDDDLIDATASMIVHTRNLVEPAGAAALAAAIALRDQLAGRTVAIVCSGGNIGPQQLARVVALIESRETQAAVSTT